MVERRRASISAKAPSASAVSLALLLAAASLVACAGQAAESSQGTAGLGDAHDLTITLAGAGRGQVTVGPYICSSQPCVYPLGDQQVLRAEPAVGNVFVGWSGACHGRQAVCAVNMKQDLGVTATFAVRQAVLTVSSGRGGVVATSVSPSNVEAGTSGRWKVAQGTAVTLVAYPHSGHFFLGWTGACAAETSTTCHFTFTGAASAGARYSTTVSVTAGSGGAVVSEAHAFTCTGTCNLTVPVGTPVTFTAVASTGQIFTGWSGACLGLQSLCNVHVGEPTFVGAHFGAPRATIALAVGRGGSAAVYLDGSYYTSVASETTTDFEIPIGTYVMVQAQPWSGLSIGGWSGACAGTSNVCSGYPEHSTPIRVDFAAPVYVNRGGNGSGSILSTPAGINCGTQCMTNYLVGSSAALVAVPDANSVFGGWAGPCAATHNEVCSLQTLGPSTITAIFYSVSDGGTGGGTGGPGDGTGGGTDGGITGPSDGGTGGIDYGNNYCPNGTTSSSLYQPDGGAVSPGSSCWGAFCPLSGAPSEPTGLSVYPGDGWVNVTWTPPSSGGASEVTGYVVTAYPDCLSMYVPGMTTTTPLAVFSGLNNGSTYTFTVRAFNSAAGGGPESQPSSSATPQAPSAPSEPQSFSATPGDGTVHLTWSAPANEGGSPVSYVIDASPTIDTVTLGPGASSYDIYGLVNGTSYSFRIYAYNNTGSSAYAYTATIPAAPPPSGPQGNYPSLLTGPYVAGGTGVLSTRVAMADNGTYALGWVNFDVGHTWASLQHFNASGSAVGSSAISSSSYDMQGIAAVGTSNAGISAMAYLKLGNSQGERVRIAWFDTSGNVIDDVGMGGSEGELPTDPRPPALVVNGDGTVVVAFWTTETGDTAGTLRLRVVPFGMDRTPQTGGDLVSGYPGSAYPPALASNDSGRFLAMYGAPGYATNVMLMQYGSPIGSISVSMGGTWPNPSLALAPDSTFALAWVDNGAGGGTGNGYLQFFDAYGYASGSQVSLNTNGSTVVQYTADLPSVSVALDRFGIATVVWASPVTMSSDVKLMGRRVSSVDTSQTEQVVLGSGSSGSYEATLGPPQVAGAHCSDNFVIGYLAPSASGPRPSAILGLGDLDGNNIADQRCQ